MRLFFALWPPADAAHALAAWAKNVQRDAGGRASAEDSIHLTLAFLGEADPLKAAAAGRKARGRRFELPIDACKYWRHNRIVWAGPRDMPAALRDLAGALREALKGGAFALEERPFAAHITLVRKASAPSAIPQLPRVSWPVSEFVLVRSRPQAGGSRYEITDRFALAD